MSHRKYKHVLVPIAAWGIAFFLVAFGPFGFLVDAFIRVEKNRILYISFFFAFLLVSYILVAPRVPLKRNFLWSTMLGACAGLMSSILSLLAINCLDESGWSGILQTVNRFGLIDMAAAFIYLSLILGGWALGMFVFGFAPLFKKKTFQAATERRIQAP